MKAFQVSLLLLLFLAACKKEKEEATPENPNWLNAEIARMDNDPSYTFTEIKLFKWNNSLYYVYHIPFSSCFYCDVYTYEGNKYTLTNEDDFSKKAELIKVVWVNKD